MSLISWLLEKWEEAQSSKTSRPRSTFRPFLEILEVRVALSTFAWKEHPVNSDWTNPNNWFTSDGGVTYPGDPNVAGSAHDVAIF